MNLRQSLITATILLLLSGMLCAVTAVAQDDPIVESATPSYAMQGTYDLEVEIVGSNFGRGATVNFLAHCDDVGDKPEYCDLPAQGVKVGSAKAKGSTKLTVKVSVEEESYVGPIDIEVELYGRKGKGTTKFTIQAKDSGQPSDCMLDFDATFDDLSDEDSGDWVDGVRSDGNGPYYAFGGTGLRLDTNGSMKLEANNDPRFITIDFSRAVTCDLNDPNNAAGAAGFCMAEKGSDMRFEHQVQVLQDNGLCLLGSGDSMRVSMGFTFLQSPGGSLTNEFKNGRQNGDGSTALKLNYGCQGSNLLQSDLRIGADGGDDYRAVVTRIDEFSWRIEGEWACLHTNLGYKLENAEGTVYLQMPFGLTIVDVNAPPSN